MIGVCPGCKNQTRYLVNFCNKCGTELPTQNNNQFKFQTSFMKKNSHGICGFVAHVIQSTIKNTNFCSSCGKKTSITN